MVTAENAVLLSIALFVLLALFYGPWQGLCVDWGRQQIFEARNALFDLAAEGKLSFESPEYRTIRSNMETLIRFSHRVSWPRLLFYSMCGRPKGRGPELLALTNRIDDPKIRLEVRRLILKMAWGTIGILIFRSGLLLPFFALAWVARKIYAPADEQFQKTSRGVYRVVQEDATRFEGRDIPMHRAA